MGSPCNAWEGHAWFAWVRVTEERLAIRFYDVSKPCCMRGRWLARPRERSSSGPGTGSVVGLLVAGAPCARWATAPHAPCVTAREAPRGKPRSRSNPVDHRRRLGCWGSARDGGVGRTMRAACAGTVPHVGRWGGRKQGQTCAGVVHPRPIHNKRRRTSWAYGIEYQLIGVRMFFPPFIRHPAARQRLTVRRASVSRLHLAYTPPGVGMLLHGLSSFR